MKGDNMTLTSFLSTLKTPNVNVLVKDSEDNEVCKITASSVAALDNELERRTINRWYLNGATSLTVVLNEPTISA